MKDYISRYGYSIHQILKMPRRRFATMFGQQYLGISRSKFIKVLKRETPNITAAELRSRDIWKIDTMANKPTYEATQIGWWEDPCVLI